MFDSTWAEGKQAFSHIAGETKTIVSSWDVRDLFVSVTKYDRFKFILTQWFWKGSTNLSVQGQEAKAGALPLCSLQACSQQLLHKTPNYKGQNVCGARASLWPHQLRTSRNWEASMWGRQGETVTKVKSSSPRLLQEASRSPWLPAGGFIYP